MLEEGRKPTIQSIRAALGSQGSLTTIQQFKKELEEEELAAKDSPQALESFRTVWSLGVQEGLSRRDVEVQDLKDTIEALSSDSKKLEGEAIACRFQVSEISQKYEQAVTRLNILTDELAKTREVAERNATKLVEATERYHQQTEALRELLATQQTKNHELELTLARTEAKLEAVLPSSAPNA